MTSLGRLVPGVFLAKQQAWARAIACVLPAHWTLPLRRLPVDKVRQELADQVVVPFVSRLTVGCWLHQDALRPWYHTDDKTGMQILQRTVPTRPPQTSRVMRTEHEYRRRGIACHLASLDVRTVQVTGCLELRNAVEAAGPKSE